MFKKLRFIDICLDCVDLFPEDIYGSMSYACTSESQKEHFVHDLTALTDQDVDVGPYLMPDIGLRQILAITAQRVAQTNGAAVVKVAFNIVQQTVHQRQTTGARHQFEADKRAMDLEILSVAIKVIQIVGLRLQIVRLLPDIAWCE